MLSVAFALVGLSPIGPVAGGIFAGAQAAGAVSAGGSWAVAQSLAMGGMPVVSTSVATVTGAAGAYLG